MSSVCRICLAGNMSLLSLKNNLLIDIYEKLSNNKFNSKDARPRALCCYCYGKLLKCYTFSQMAKRSENVLSQLFHQGLEATHEYITGVNPGRNPPLSISSMRFANSDDNATDKGSFMIIKDEPTPSIDIKIEVITEQEEMVEVESEADQVNSAEEHALNVNVKQPKTNDLKMLFHCNYCNNIYFLKSELISHIKKFHSQNKGRPYSLTEQHLDKNSKKHRDKITHKGNKLYACNECGKKFERKYHYIRHQRTHTEDKLFACSVCDKQFNRKDNLTTHMRIHTSEKPFACNVQVCAKQFWQKGNLISHMTTHTGEKPFACSVCDKKFTLKSLLKKHMRIHTGDKPFVCSVCGKQFNRKSNLNVHMRIHTGEKPFTCNVCDKQYKHKSNLEKHMTIHP